MPSLEEEAFARAQQMNRINRNYSNSNSQKKAQPTEDSAKSKTSVKSESKDDHAQSEKTGVFDSLFKNKEQSLILLLIVLLMDEQTEPTLLLALIYLLI